jgi:hypothetical protein
MAATSPVPYQITYKMRSNEFNFDPDGRQPFRQPVHHIPSTIAAGPLLRLLHTSVESSIMHPDSL